MLKKHTLISIWLFLIIFCTVTSGVQEQWLSYRYHRQARKIVPYAGGTGQQPEEEAPSDVKLPEFESDSPVFYEWHTPMAEGGVVLTAFDNDRKHGPHNLIYIDSNCNGHLDDEKAVKAYQTGQNSSYFGPVRVIFDTEEGPITYHLNFRYYSDVDSDYESVSVYSGCWYEGEVKVGGEKKKCILMDSNLNGTFNDKGVDKPDRIQIGEKSVHEPPYVGNYLEVDEKLYNLEVARDGAFVKIEAAEDVTYGSFKVPETIGEFSAGGENGLFWCSLDNGRGKLPEGEYKVYRWTIERKDDEEDNWKIDARSFQKGDSFEIAHEKEVAIDIGEPLICTFSQNRRNNRYYFSQKLEGKNGEYITLLKNKSRPKAATLHIESKDGSYARDFTFEYG